MIAFINASATLHLSLLFGNNYFCQKRYYFITFKYKSKKITKYISIYILLYILYIIFTLYIYKEFNT